MKIKQQSASKYICFGCLHLGDVFQTEIAAYMVTDSVILKNGIKVNCVTLHGGELAFFEQDTLVVPLPHAELNLN